MPEKKSTIGTRQGQKPHPEQPPITPEDEASAGPHDSDHQVVININTEKE